MLRIASFVIVFAFTFAELLGQQPVSLVSGAASSPIVDTVRTGVLPAGKSVRDSSGRVVENNGTNNNGGVHFTYTGRLTFDAQGNITCNGDISNVTNPASQGSNGEIYVNTNGQPTTIDLERNGSQSSPLPAQITGGNATVNVSGDWVTVRVGGTNNNVGLNGRMGFGEGLDGQSEGNARLRGNAGNGWRSNGGNWTVHS